MVFNFQCLVVLSMVGYPVIWLTIHSPSCQTTFNAKYIKVKSTLLNAVSHRLAKVLFFFEISSISLSLGAYIYNIYHICVCVCVSLCVCVCANKHIYTYLHKYMCKKTKHTLTPSSKDSG